MAFNVEQALKDGLTEEQLADYLSETRKFNRKAATDAGYTHRQVIDFLSERDKLADAPMPTPQPQVTKEKSKGIGVVPAIKEATKLAKETFIGYPLRKGIELAKSVIPRREERPAVTEQLEAPEAAPSPVLPPGLYVPTVRGQVEEMTRGARGPQPFVEPARSAVAAAEPTTKLRKYGLRPDKTPKGPGYFGELRTPTGAISTEISIGVDFDGKETLIPSLVPTLTQDEINYLLGGGQPTESIMSKAVEHAKGRMAKGLSPFAQSGETPIATEAERQEQLTLAAEKKEKAPIYGLPTRKPQTRALEPLMQTLGLGKGPATPIERARASNLIALSGATGGKLSPSEIEPIYEDLMEKIGLKQYPTPMELYPKLGIAVGLLLGGFVPGVLTAGAGYVGGTGAGTAAQLGLGAIRAGLGVTGYMGLKEVENVTVQALAGEKPKPLQGREAKEFLGPLKEPFAGMAEAGEILLPVPIAGKVAWKARNWFGKQPMAKQRGIVKLIEDKMKHGQTPEDIAKQWKDPNVIEAEWRDVTRKPPTGEGSVVPTEKPLRPGPQGPQPEPEPLGSTIPPPGMAPVVESKPPIPQEVSPPIEALVPGVPTMMGPEPTVAPPGMQPIEAAVPEISPEEAQALAEVKTLDENTERLFREGGYRVAKKQPRSKKGEESLFKRGYRPMIWDPDTDQLVENILGTWVKPPAPAPAPEVEPIKPEEVISEAGGAVEGVPSGYFPAEELWGKTPQDVEENWQTMYSHYETTKTQAQPEIKKLEAEYKSLTGPGSMQAKKAIKERIDDIKAGYEMILADAESNLINEQLKHKEEVERLASDAGLKGDDLERFIVDYDIAISSNPPDYEFNYNKTNQRIFDELLEEYAEKAGAEPLNHAMPFEEWSKDPALVKDAAAVAAKVGVKPENLEYVGIQSLKPISDEAMHQWNVTDPKSPKFGSTVEGKKFIQGPKEAGEIKVPPTAQHLELMPEEYPEIEAVAVKQDGKVYKDHTHANIVVDNNLDPEKAVPGFVTTGGEFIEQYRKMPPRLLESDRQRAERFVDQLIADEKAMSFQREDLIKQLMEPREIPPAEEELGIAPLEKPTAGLKALGFDEKQIERMKPEVAQDLVHNQTPAEEVSITQDGDVAKVAKKKEPAAAKGKHPWEMTREEFGIDYVRSISGQEKPDLSEYPQVEGAYAEHKKAVQHALLEDWDVSPEVLKDYPELAEEARVSPEAKVESTKEDWSAFTPNKQGYQPRELSGLKEGYFVAQQSPERFDIIETKRGQTKAIVHKTPDGWKFNSEVPVIGKDKIQFQEGSKIFDNPQNALLEFNRYKDIIDKPETTRVAQYVEFGSPHVHRNAVINAINRGESPKGLEDYPELQKELEVLPEAEIKVEAVVPTPVAGPPGFRPVIEKLPKKETVKAGGPLIGTYNVGEGGAEKSVDQAFGRDLRRFAKELQTELGWEADPKIKLSSINIPPTGGDGYILMWKPDSEYGIYVKFPVTRTRDGSLRVKGFGVPHGEILWRWTTKKNVWTGLGNQWTEKTITPKELADLVRSQEARVTGQEVKPEDVDYPKEEAAPEEKPNLEELFEEYQFILQNLPRNIGKAKQEGKLSKNQLTSLDRANEIEEIVKPFQQEWDDISKKKYKEAMEVYTEGQARRREDAANELTTAGFKEGDKVTMVAASFLPTAPGMEYEGTVKIDKNGNIYVLARGTHYDLFRNPWKKVREETKPSIPEPEPTPTTLPPGTVGGAPPVPAQEEAVTLPTKGVLEWLEKPEEVRPIKKLPPGYPEITRAEDYWDKTPDQIVEEENLVDDYAKTYKKEQNEMADFYAKQTVRPPGLVERYHGQATKDITRPFKNEQERFIDLATKRAKALGLNDDEVPAFREAIDELIGNPGAKKIQDDFDDIVRAYIPKEKLGGPPALKEELKVAPVKAPEVSPPGAPQPEEAPPPKPPTTGNRWVRNPSTGKIELYFAREDFDALPANIKDSVRRYFNWAPSRKAWVSKGSKNIYVPKQVVATLEKEGIFKAEEEVLPKTPRTDEDAYNLGVEHAKVGQRYYPPVGKESEYKKGYEAELRRTREQYATETGRTPDDLRKKAEIPGEKKPLTEGELQTEYSKRGYLVAVQPAGKYIISDKNNPLRGNLKIFAKERLENIGQTIKDFEEMASKEEKPFEQEPAPSAVTPPGVGTPPVPVALPEGRNLWKGTVYGRNYNKLARLFGKWGLGRPEDFAGYQKLKVPGGGGSIMDFNVEFLRTDEEGNPIFALSHYYKQEGDLIPDPDMEIRVRKDGSIEALTFQDYRSFTEVYPEPGKVDQRAKKDLNAFLGIWLKNIDEQGHMVVEGEEAEVPQKPQMIASNPEADKYVVAIKNENKKGYAIAYHNWIRTGRVEDYQPKPKDFGDLSFMGAQAVRMELDRYYPEGQETTRAEVPTEVAGTLSTAIRDRILQKAEPYLYKDNAENLVISLEKLAGEAYGEIVNEIAGELTPDQTRYLNAWNSEKFAKTVMGYIERNDLLKDRVAEGPPRGFKAEMLVGNDWGSNALVFATKEEAEKYASDLFSRWFAAKDKRAVPVAQAPNYQWTDEGAKPIKAVEEKPTEEPRAEKPELTLEMLKNAQKMARADAKDYIEAAIRDFEAGDIKGANTLARKAQNVTGQDLGLEEAIGLSTKEQLKPREVKPMTNFAAFMTKLKDIGVADAVVDGNSVTFKVMADDQGYYLRTESLGRRIDYPERFQDAAPVLRIAVNMALPDKVDIKGDLRMEDTDWDKVMYITGRMLGGVAHGNLTRALKAAEKDQWDEALTQLEAGYRILSDTAPESANHLRAVIDQTTIPLTTGKKEPILKKGGGGYAGGTGNYPTDLAETPDDRGEAPGAGTENLPRPKKEWTVEDLHQGEGPRTPEQLPQFTTRRPPSITETEGLPPEGPGAEPSGQPSVGVGHGERPGVQRPGRGTDHVIKPADLIRQGSWRDQAKTNLDVIELVKKLQAENRPATPEEQTFIAKYTGWGSSELANNMFPGYVEKREVLPAWAREEHWRKLAERLISLLTPEEIKVAVNSTQFAHYTSAPVVRSIYRALEKFGFRGGKVFEPGMGTGNFFGLMPETMRNSTKYTGIEYDPTTSAIAEYLYPRQNILHGDFTKQKFPNNFFDLAIGNPPFRGGAILVDPDYKKYRFNLHEYFFAKSLDKIRPGGILAFVSSRYLMDKVEDKARAYFMGKADFIGAIRLPQTAFKENAGTEVVTDVLFFRKKTPGEETTGMPWSNLKEVETPEGKFQINEYFVDHPEMVLGTHSGKGKMYTANEYTVLPMEGDIEDHFAKAVEHLPDNVYSIVKQAPETQQQIIHERDFNPLNRKEGGLYISEKGEVMAVEHGSGVPLLSLRPKITKEGVDWIKGFIGLRDAVRKSHHDQLTEGPWEESLSALQKTYQDFVKRYGRVNAFTTYEGKETDEEGNVVTVERRRYKYANLFRIDPEATLVTALETETEAGDLVEAPVLQGRTLMRPIRREIKTTPDALAVSLDLKGGLDIDHIAGLSNRPAQQVIEELGDLIYKDPSIDGYVLADNYLSGDVVAKLAEARVAAGTDPQYQRNVEALIKAQPLPLTPMQITVNLGAPWVPDEYVTQFAHEILGIPEGMAIKYNAADGNWDIGEAPEKVTGGYYRRSRKKTRRVIHTQQLRGAEQEWGTPDRGPNELLESVLNNKTIRITREDEDRKVYLDTVATAAANDVAKKMKDRFRSWVWEDTDRTKDLVDLWNTTRNNIAPRRVDGAHLTTPGVTTTWEWKKHQKDAIWRIVQDGNVYLGHAMGAGKTSVYIAAGMEMKRLGLIRKPIYAVPKSVLQQFANEFQYLYPMANVMVADEENFHTDNRRRFVAQAALNNPDAIIITHSALGMLKMTPEAINPVRDALIEELRNNLEDLESSGVGRMRLKQMENRIDKLQQRFDSMIQGGDENVTFEDLGADFIFVDEAHMFRKLDFTTNIQAKGIDPEGSKRSLDLYIKTRWLDGKNPGRSHVFGTGTPITNTIGELYTVMRYFSEEQMEKDGIRYFDSWAKTFGDMETRPEMNSAGRYEMVSRFSRFVNVHDLMTRVKMFMDVLTMSQLGGLVIRPEIQGGKAEIVITPPSEELRTYQREELQPRIEISRKWKPSKEEKGNPDPLINIITDGRLAAIDMRFVRNVPSNPNSKLNKWIDGIIESYKRFGENTYLDEKGNPSPKKGGTILGFYNLGFGEQVAERRGFNARSWTMKRFKEAGIPSDDVIWFMDYAGPTKRVARMRVQREFNKGDKRIMIGSAKTMGVGLNPQNRAAVSHYLDNPWYPADVEQPDGRILRQGNQNKTIEMKRYATKGSYDATQWQMVARKSGAIEVAFTGENVRVIEDISETSQYEMAAALAAGDERAIRVAVLKGDIENLRNLQSAHYNNQRDMEYKRTSDESGLRYNRSRLKELQEAYERVDEYVSRVKGKVGEKSFDTREPGEKQAFGEAIIEAYKGMIKKPGSAEYEQQKIGRTKIGVIGGEKDQKFPIYVRVTTPRKHEFDLHLELQVTSHVEYEIANGSVWPFDEDTSPAGLVSKFANKLTGISSEVSRTESSIRELDEEVKKLNAKVGTPYPNEQEMNEKIAELSQLESELLAESTAADLADAAARASDPVELALEQRLSEEYGTKITRGQGFNDFRFLDKDRQEHKIPLEEVRGYREQLKKELAPQAPTSEPESPDRTITPTPEDRMNHFFLNVREGEGRGWREVKGKSVKIKGFEDFDLFLHKNTNPESIHQWVISEGKSGFSMASGTTQKDAIATAEKTLSSQTVKDLEKAIQKGLKNIGETSPRYGREKVKSEKDKAGQEKRSKKEGKKEEEGGMPPVYSAIPFMLPILGMREKKRSPASSYLPPGLGR